MIASAQALRLLTDLALDDGAEPRFEGASPLAAPTSRRPWAGSTATSAPSPTGRWSAPAAIPGLRVYGPAPGVPRSPLLAFTVTGTDPRTLASDLDRYGVEARAGCHCASLAHRHLGLERPGTCRLSFAAYTSERDVDRAMDALADVVRRS